MLDHPLPVLKRTLVLIGLMGAGKSTIGRALAERLSLPFYDSDQVIEEEMGMSISDIFTTYGEAFFRKLESTTIEKLSSGEPVILATGGGAFMNEATQAILKQTAVTLWLKCDLHVLIRRVRGRTHRPLLHQKSPSRVLKNLMQERYPVYAKADITVHCGDQSVKRTTSSILKTLVEHPEMSSSKTSSPRLLDVKLKGGVHYNIHIGPHILNQATSFLGKHALRKRAFIITDENVARLHLAPLTEHLAAHGIQAETFVIPAGENSKSFSQFEKLTTDILSKGIERKTSLIALGGGVVGDLTGFCASTLLRGIPFIQIPTTLLSQIDSSVGGKTGINTKVGKNLVGTFYQPKTVIADTATLATLPLRELKAGYAEIVKAGLIGDSALFDWCEHYGAKVLKGDETLLMDAVEKACRFKIDVVQADEREEKNSGGRALLNLGHTFGHALEAEFGYDGRLLHGEAVSIGMVLAFRLSVQMGLCPSVDLSRLTAHLSATELPYTLSALPFRPNPERLIAHMQHDKKLKDGKIAFVLARGIGQAFTCNEVNTRDLLTLLTDSD